MTVILHPIITTMSEWEQHSMERHASICIHCDSAAVIPEPNTRPQREPSASHTSLRNNARTDQTANIRKLLLPYYVPSVVLYMKALIWEGTVAIATQSFQISESLLSETNLQFQKLQIGSFYCTLIKPRCNCAMWRPSPYWMSELKTRHTQETTIRSM